MNEEKLHRIIIQAAKSIPSDESAPYAFEKRIMSRIRQAAQVDLLGLWSRMLWRAALPALAVMILAGAWSHENKQASVSEPELTDLEYAVLVPVDFSPEENW
jgi:uncharacterized iron-regulated membrane protein